MKNTRGFFGSAAAVAVPVTIGLAGLVGLAQQPGRGFPPGGPGPGGPGGPGFPGQQERAIVEQFDRNGDKRLDANERKAARQFLEANPAGPQPGRGRGFGPPNGMEPVTPGPTVTRASVKPVPSSVPFYDLSTLRTLFFEFDNKDWEDELMVFKSTDVEVPATLVVDGKTYKDVGVKFRGASSFNQVPEGRKHSLNVSVDFVHEKQDVGGYTSLNLLNAHEDPTFLRAVLYLQAARDYLPAAKANFVRVVINGELWGIYSNVQQVNKKFLTEWYKNDAGTRWKVPGGPGARGGLEYVGDDITLYKRTFEIKSKDDPKAWAQLVKLTKVLNETPPEKLEAALAPILDIDGALRFLAIDNALVNNDGYWVRASDYNIYLDQAGRFHVLPHDTNETFAAGGGRGGPMGPNPGRGGRGPGGFGPPPPDGGGRGQGRPGGQGGQFGPGMPGGGRGPGMMGGDARLDPLIGLDDPGKPLRSKLLAVPSLRAKYLGYVKDIATKSLDWNQLGPRIAKYHDLIAADVKADTRKLDTDEAFEAGPAALKGFAEARRAFLLDSAPK